jgi:hypothetical protein
VDLVDSAHSPMLYRPRTLLSCTTAVHSLARRYRARILYVPAKWVWEAPASSAAFSSGVRTQAALGTTKYETVRQSGHARTSCHRVGPPDAKYQQPAVQHSTVRTGGQAKVTQF